MGARLLLAALAVLLGPGASMANTQSPASTVGETHSFAYTSTAHEIQGVSAAHPVCRCCVPLLPNLER
jgi:hypothetical protein